MPDPASRRRRLRWVLLGDLEEHSVREVCQGAAEYAASRPGIDLDPWSTYPGTTLRPTPARLGQADGVLLNEIDLTYLGGPGARLGKPHVFYLANVPHRRAPSVSLDETAIGRTAAAHLIDRGYRHLAFFGSRIAPWAVLRSDGFRAAARERGLEVEHRDVLPAAGQVYRVAAGHGRHAVQRALTSLPKPCGIFAAHDVAACYVIQAARALGFRVPGDFGVIGVDADPIANAAAGLAISTIEVPFREAGWRAAALLDGLVRGERPPAPPPLPPVRLIVRTSTNAFTVADPLVRAAQELIEQHRGGRATVGSVVAALGTTAVTLSRRFREQLKLTPGEYILQRRLEHARELLRAGGMTVAQVSAACGFHDCSYFCQVFKRATGTSPGRLLPNR